MKGMIADIPTNSIIEIATERANKHIKNILSLLSRSEIIFFKKKLL
jgi:riboflavin synthase